MENKIIHGDCLVELKTLEENSVDSIVCDPPYELGFMGKSWDNTGIANNVEMWKECLRVLKPGGHLLAFAGTRTYHRMASAIEDAGFEVRDMIEWVYGSGFPKSLNIGKAVDKLQGNEREVVGENPNDRSSHGKNAISMCNSVDGKITKGTSEWEGWGTALKPSHEPIIVSMKPLQVKQIYAILIDNIWKHLPASDVTNNLRDTQVKLDEVVNSVPENVRTNLLENIESVELVVLNSMSQGIKSEKEKENSAHEAVALSGEKQTQEITTQTGEVEGATLGDISISVQMGSISENTVLLWKNISEELLNQTNTLTTRTAIKKIIELKTLRSCLIQNIGTNIGRSTNIPPSHEPICMARKPLAEKTVAENCLKWGTGGINIDESRVEASDSNTTARKRAEVKDTSTPFGKGYEMGGNGSELGRFPANLIHDNSEEVRECFPETKTGKAIRSNSGGKTFGGENTKPVMEDLGYDDNGGNASRFFKSIIYKSKASKSERNKGMDDIEAKEWKQENSPNPNRKERPFLPVKNNHPTVKPIALMEYLIKMVTPKGGIVLDPFAGSGSTLVAAKKNGYKYIGIEMTEEYIPIINARLK